MAEAEARSHWLTKADMAASCGVSMSQFQTWNVPTVAVIGRRNYYICADVVKNRITAEIGKNEAVNGCTVDSDADAKDAFAEAKLMETKERTEKLAIANAIARKEYAPINVLEEAVGKVCGQIAAILESIPLKVKRRCPKLGARDLEVIKSEIIKCQNLAEQATVELDTDDDDPS